MTRALVVSGTDTGVGKTVFSAALVHALEAFYWKPVQAGLEEETDSEVVRQLARLPAARILSEAWRLQTPASPHLAAEIQGVEIVPQSLNPPQMNGPLVIEGAGGLLVPLTRDVLLADVFSRWALPVILCARTDLGAINHALLSVEALRSRSIPILGIAFVGDENAETERIIADIGAVRRLGRLPRLDPLSPRELHAAFAANFDLAAFHQAIS